MTIKEIAARTGVSADTLRYYERMGMAACAIMKKILWNGLLSFRL